MNDLLAKTTRPQIKSLEVTEKETFWYKEFMKNDTPCCAVFPSKL